MKPGVVIVGAGGHAKVVIEILRSTGERVDWCIAATGAPALCLDVPVLTGDAHMERLRQEGYSRVFVAIGPNQLRDRLAASAVAAGLSLISAISPHAIISPSANIGGGVAVMPGAIINAAVHVEDLAIINTGACVDHDCVIGRAAHVGPQCGLAGNVEVGDRTLLGVGCSVVPGARIGRDAIVGAGAVVVSDLPDGVTAVGIPARTRPRPFRSHETDFV